MENININEQRDALLADLANADMSENNKRYITAVVKYLDENIPRNVEIESYLKVGVIIAGKIKSRTTGIPEIDNALPYTIPNVENYIAAISPNGGLYSYVNKTYSEEQIIESANNPITDIKSGDLMESLKGQDLSDDHKAYIEAAVKYISENSPTAKNFGEHIYGAHDAVTAIKSGKTGVEILDRLKGDVPPYVDNYISVLSTNGGIYSYTLKWYVPEKSSDITGIENLVKSDEEVAASYTETSVETPNVQVKDEEVIE